MLQNAEEGGKRAEKRCPDNVAMDMLQHLRMPKGADLKKQPVAVLLLDVRGSSGERVLGACKGFVSRNLNAPEFKFNMNWPDVEMPELLLQLHEEAIATWYHVENAAADSVPTFVVKLGAGAFKKRPVKSPRSPSMSPASIPSPKSTGKKKARRGLGLASPPPGNATPSAFALPPAPPTGPPPLVAAPPAAPSEAWIISHMLEEEAFMDSVWRSTKDTTLFVHKVMGKCFLNGD